MRVLYLHGFASSPQSRKAQFFASQLNALGFPIEIPDLAQGDFEHLTISRQLALIDRIANHQPVGLIGSSLGGYLAAIYAARHPEVNRLILMAPAFGFHQLWAAELGPERLQLWKEHGTMPVFHYAEQRDVPLAYEFIQDAVGFDPFPNFQQPAIIFHGNCDTVVPVENSIQFARCHPNVQLVRVASGHELTDVLDTIWHFSRDFLLDGAPGKK